MNHYAKTESLGIATDQPPGVTLRNRTEEELLVAVRAGSHNAFEELISRSRSTYSRVVKYILQNADDAAGMPGI